MKDSIFCNARYNPAMTSQSTDSKSCVLSDNPVQNDCGVLLVRTGHLDVHQCPGVSLRAVSLHRAPTAPPPDDVEQPGVSHHPGSLPGHFEWSQPGPVGAVPPLHQVKELPGAGAPQRYR